MFAALLALGTFVLAAVPATGAAVCLRIGGCGPERDLLEVDMKGSRFAPIAMPRRMFVPAAFKTNVGIGMSLGSHPSALREALFEVDRDVAVNVRGLPVCKTDGPRLSIRRPNELRRAEKACGASVVGRGQSSFSIAFPGLPPISRSSRVVLFNGGVRDGATVLHALAEIKVPVPRVLVARIEILPRTGDGQSVRVTTPVVAGGAGSLTHVALNVGRNFAFRGKRRSFLSARCPDGKFEVAAKMLRFRNEAGLPSAAAQTLLRGNYAVPCKPKR